MTKSLPVNNAAETSDADEPFSVYHDSARELIQGVDRSFVSWIVREVARRVPAEWDERRRSDLFAKVEQRAGVARAECVANLSALFASGVALQSRTPLQVVRAALTPITSLLEGADVPEVPRDRSRQEFFPNDVYDLGPTTFGEIDTTLEAPALRWGAAKAMLVLRARQQG